jgi:hypothetical protein
LTAANIRVFCGVVPVNKKTGAYDVNAVATPLVSPCCD